MMRPGQSLLAKLNFSRSSEPEVVDSIPFPAKTIERLLKELSAGYLNLYFPNGEKRSFGKPNDPLHAEIRFHRWSAFKDILKHGDIGFAEGYIRGDWDSPNLEKLLDLAVKNRNVLEQAIYGNWFGSLVYRIRHLLNRNSKMGSRKNIHAHYDLGNAFYTLWLDPSMTYSSAWFDSKEELVVQDAQKAKYQRILNSLELHQPSEILEIGCGWGGFMEEAAKAGHRVTGLTLSTEQQAYASKRLAQHWPNYHQVRMQDYRDCKDQFDGIASIEMFEAVGEQYWPSYFEALARCLKKDGKACIQTIVIAENLFDRYRKSTDFIQQYIFPGGMLPSREAFKRHAKNAGLQIDGEFAFGPDYAKTLCVWYDNFNQKLSEIKQLGFDEAFIRLWNFYLLYCAAGFKEKNIDVVQFTLSHQKK
ncbi:Cfa Cyclopropane fatty acid synthase and related methyltransferases [Burkholderiaceae bacterium]